MQVTSVVLGFVLPRLIIGKYGSSVNGLVGSIQQFLTVISFLELGVGAVVESALYKPLAERNMARVSEVISSANRYFKRIAIILLVYVAVLIGVYPTFVNTEFDFVYTAALIAAMCLNLFSEYYFGIVDGLLLLADQRGYVQYLTRIATLAINIIACAVLIKLGASIQLVKLTTSLIYVARPFVYRLYVKKHYSINRRVKYKEEPIKQKWNGIAQHISSFVLDGTDVMVLTVLSDLANVSIYNAYSMVLTGIKNLMLSLTHGVKAYMGELWAKQEVEKLRTFFSWIEWLVHNATVFVFGCASVLIVPFISVYTDGVTDANYIVPAFGILLTVAHGMHCLRLPYILMIFAGNHYKQTQTNFIISAAINIVISVLTVKFWGLIGVTLGTLAAMLFQTTWMAWYISKNPAAQIRASVPSLIR